MANVKISFTFPSDLDNVEIPSEVFSKLQTLNHFMLHSESFYQWATQRIENIIHGGFEDPGDLLDQRKENQITTKKNKSLISGLIDPKWEDPLFDIAVIEDVHKTKR